jgi:vacuolar-type H+-ATPase subunit C/Vma6
MVKQETYQRAGVVAKKYKILTDGEALEEEEFTDEVAGTLGAYATTNQYSVGALKAWLKQKNLLINKLEAWVAMAEENARDEANKGFEQARVTDQ